jgi:arsenite-transporting ATPase
VASVDTEPLPGLSALADALAAAGHGLIMVMGKGGVGKTTVAAALALGLVKRGKTVHLSTIDPAAHLVQTLGGEVPGLQLSRLSIRSLFRPKSVVNRSLKSKTDQ